MTTISIFLTATDSGPGPTVELADGTQFPQWCDFGAIIDNGPSISLRVIVEDGRPILDTFFVARQNGATGPLTASAIHSIPVDKLFREAVPQIARFVAGLDGRREGAAPALRGRRITDDLLKQVADVVRTDPLNEPNKAVQRHLHCSSRTASRWIGAARDRGFLKDEQKG